MTPPQKAFACRRQFAMIRLWISRDIQRALRALSARDKQTVQHLVDQILRRSLAARGIHVERRLPAELPPEPAEVDQALALLRPTEPEPVDTEWHV